MEFERLSCVRRKSIYFLPQKILLRRFASSFGQQKMLSENLFRTAIWFSLLYASDTKAGSRII